MTSLESHLEDQVFLPYQLEAAIGTIFVAGIYPADAIHYEKPLVLGLYSLALAAVTLVSLSPVGSFLHLVSVGTRLLLGGIFSYDAIIRPPNPWDKGIKASLWILIDPLGWMMELAIFFHLEHPILPAIWSAIWSVRRATIAGCLLTIGHDRRWKVDEIKVWTILMAFIMIVQIIVNLSEEDYIVTLGTVLLLLINHMLGNNEAESDASEVFQKDFMIPFIILNLVRVFRRK